MLRKKTLLKNADDSKKSDNNIQPSAPKEDEVYIQNSQATDSKQSLTDDKVSNSTNDNKVEITKF